MEKFLFRKVELWVVLLLLVLFGLALVFFGWLILQGLTGTRIYFPRLTSTAVSVAAAPNTLRKVVTGSFRSDEHEVEARFAQGSGFTYLTEISDPQYVLVSRYDGDIRWSVVELYREGENAPVHRWAFSDAAALAVDAPNPGLLEVKTLNRHFRTDAPPSFALRMVHPWLDADGLLSVHAHDGAQYQLDACATPIWANKEFLYHHSLEGGLNGSLWSAGARQTEIGGYGWDGRMRDDYAVQLDADGAVIYSKSVLQMLEDAGLLNLVYDYDTYQRDPIHLNDVQPVLEDGTHWKSGDILLSLAHLNMVLLFRPATDELVWWSQDRMMHQHDVDIIGDGVVTVFDNRRRTNSRNQAIVLGPNEVLSFELPSPKARAHALLPLAEMDIRTISQGLVDHIPGAGMMVEETNYGRLVKFAEDGTPEWIYVNRSESDKTWTMNWSRYVPKDVGDAAVDALAGTNCR